MEQYKSNITPQKLLWNKHKNKDTFNTLTDIWSPGSVTDTGSVTVLILSLELLMMHSLLACTGEPSTGEFTGEA